MGSKLPDFYSQGVEAFEQDNYEAAEKFFTEGFNRQGSIECLIALGITYTNTERIQKAKQLFLKAIKIAPPELKAAAMLHLASIYAHSGKENRQKAKMIFRDLFEMEPSADLLDKYVDLLLADHDLDEAERVITEAKNKKLQGIYMPEADLLMFKNQPQAAIDILREHQKNDVEACLKLGCLLFHIDHFAEALVFLKDALRRGKTAALRWICASYVLNKQPQNAIIYGNLARRANQSDVCKYLGDAYQYINEYEKAIENFQEALKLNIQPPRTIFSLTECYFHMKDFEKALEYSDAALKLLSRKGSYITGTWFLRGHIMTMLDKPEEAIRCYRRSLPKDQDYASQTCCQLGIIYAEKGKDKKAMAYFEDAWLMKNSYAACKIAEIYFKYEKYPEAEHWYLTALNHGHKDMLVKLAHTLRKQKKYDEARKRFIEASDLGFNEATIGLALLAADNGDNSEATALFEKCIEKNIPGTPVAYGHFLMGIGDFGSAQPFLEKAFLEHEETDPQIIFELAMSYLLAEDPLKNTELAKKYLLKAARDGSKAAWKVINDRAKFNLKFKLEFTEEELQSIVS